MMLLRSISEMGPQLRTPIAVAAAAALLRSFIVVVGDRALPSLRHGAGCARSSPLRASFNNAANLRRRMTASVADGAAAAQIANFI